MSALELVREHLLAAEYVLNTEYSFGLAEPHYRKCVALLRHNMGLRVAAARLVAELYSQGNLGDEPIAYLVHVLRWREVAEWARASIAALDNPMLHGGPLENVLEAFENEWEHCVFYSFED